MNTAGSERQPGSRFGGVIRFLVRLCAILLALAAFCFVFLRTYGVPDPILRHIVLKANEAGVPMDIGRVKLTIRGWRATQVRYYSKHPDDLEPIIYAEQVYFSRKVSLIPGKYPKWAFDVVAYGMTLNPSVAWRVNVPVESLFRRIDKLDVAVGFGSDRIVLYDGKVSWFNMVVHAKGTYIKPDPVSLAPALDSSCVHEGSAPVPAFLIDAPQIERWEEQIKSVLYESRLFTDISFFLDMNDLKQSRATLKVQADDMCIQGVEFSEISAAGDYNWPILNIDQVLLRKNDMQFRMMGRYDLSSGLVGGVIENSITSPDVWKLVPRSAADFLAETQLELEHLPRLSVSFGPALPEHILGELAGSFSVDRIGFRGLEAAFVKGEMLSKNGVLQVSELQAMVIGQETTAEETGSCMIGGPVNGSFVWDSNLRRLGVTAAGNIDPVLLTLPLSMFKAATNVLQRFRFAEHPPQVEMELGYTVQKKNSFFINVQAVANDVVVHDARLSSINVSSYYTNQVLRLNPASATRGAEFLKGNIALDFRNDLAEFDVAGTMDLATVEDLIYPQLGLFGNTVKTAADTQIVAQGALDWADMVKTDFRAEIFSAQVELPVARLHDFSATVAGEGTSLSVTDAQGKLYGGIGSGSMSIRVDPRAEDRPYTLIAEVRKADFKQFLEYINQQKTPTVSGLLTGSIDCSADLSRGFFDVANGSGQVSIKKGQLTDLPLFGGFSRVLRKVIPSFRVFSITSLRGTFEVKDGTVITQDAYFDGDLISAKGRGSYSISNGFDAMVQVQVLSDSKLSKVFRAITDPFLKLLELKLEGTLSDPSWRFDAFKVAGPGGALRRSEPDQVDEVIEDVEDEE